MHSLCQSPIASFVPPLARHPERNIRAIDAAGTLILSWDTLVPESGRPNQDAHVRPANQDGMAVAR